MFARIYRKATRLAAAAFLKVLVAAVPYKVHTVLTGAKVYPEHKRSGSAYSSSSATGPATSSLTSSAGSATSMASNTGSPYHPWTNGQAERMVRTIKDGTTRTFHYGSIDDLRRHVRDWLSAYNFAKQLRALRFRTPFEAIRKLSEEKPDLFTRKPDHHSMELNS